MDNWGGGPAVSWWPPQLLARLCILAWPPHAFPPGQHRPLEAAALLGITKIHIVALKGLLEPTAGFLEILLNA